MLCVGTFYVVMIWYMHSHMQHGNEKSSYAQKASLDEYIYTKNTPESVIVSSVEEVRRRVALAEAEESMTEIEYEVAMDKFFREELGVDRCHREETEVSLHNFIRFN